LVKRIAREAEEILFKPGTLAGFKIPGLKEEKSGKSWGTFS